MKYVSRYKKNVHFPNPVRKIVEVDPFSAIPSIAVLSSGKTIDSRLQQTGDVTIPRLEDGIDVANYAQRYKSRMEDILRIKQEMEKPSEPTPEEPKPVETE